MVVRRSQSSGMADWLQRSTAAGVFYANNTDFTTRAQLIASAAKVRFGYVGAPSGETDEDPPPAAEKVGLDTTVKLSGNGSVLLRYRNGLENLTQSGPSYAGSWDGIGATTENTVKSVFFKQWAMRFNAKWLATPHPTGTATKHMVLFGPDTGFSPGQHGHMTHSSDPRFPMAWLVHPSFTRFQNVWSSNPPGGGDHTLQTFVDLGSQSSGGLNDTNDLAYFQRRYGPVRREAGNWDAIGDFTNYPYRYQADTWYVIEHKVDQINDEVKVWFARYGDPPALITGSLHADLPPSAQYTGFQFMLRVTDATNQVFSGDDLKQWGTEFIGSDNPIPFPGGFSLPHSSAGSAPSGYPYLGSAET